MTSCHHVMVCAEVGDDGGSLLSADPLGLTQSLSVEIP